MKHTIFSILLTLLCTTSFAQIQQGVVKTPTRRNVNGTMTKGRYIENATVGILFANNNSKQSYISGTEGTFSFAASSPYYVTSVVANQGTYTFLDADFAKEQRKYSTNAIEILVDDPNVLKKVREEAMAHERGKIRNQIRAKEDELNSLMTANKISSEEYNKMLDELTKYRNSSEAIVKQIAEVYATKDFDALDDFNKQLLIFVEEGNFASADSLLKTQGSKEELFNRIKKNSAAINKTKEELKLAEEYNNKEKDAFAQRLYSEHLMYLQQPMMQDSALYCLKMRADLDTTKVSAVWSYAELCHKQKKFADCERYHLICLRAYISQNDIPNIAAIQNNCGILYRELHDYTDSEKFYKSALENYEQLFRQNPDAYRADLAMTQNNLGNLYSDLQDYDNSEKYYKAALENVEQLFRLYPDVYRADFAVTQNNLGNIYCYLHNYTNSVKHYMSALENKEHLFLQNPDAYRADLAMTQSNLGNMYNDLQDYANSEKYYKLALENYEKLFLQNPNAYRVDLAMTQNNLGNLYSDLQCYANSEKYYKAALENYEQMFRLYPDAYRENLANTQSNLGSMYLKIHDFANSEKYNKAALQNFEQLSHPNPKNLAVTQNNLGILYSNLQDYANSEKYFTSALENYEHLFRQNPNAYRADLADTQNNLGVLYLKIHDYANSEKYYRFAMDHRKQLFRQNPNTYRVDLAMTYRNMIRLYIEMNDWEQCDHYLEKTLILYADLYKSQPTSYGSYMIELQNIKVWRLLRNGEFVEAMKLAEATYAMDESVEQSKAYLAVCYNMKTLEYAKASEFDNAHASIDKAISLVPENANFYDSKGEILLMQGKNDEALKMWKKVLELNPDFLKGYPDGTDLSNGLKKLGLIE